MGHKSHTRPLQGLFVIRTLGLLTINACVKSEVPTFTLYGNIKG